jgi:DNA transposition AAA+ family ATPase
MKRDVFVENVGNVQRLMEAVRRVEKRGAPEDSWLLVEGEPGGGKSEALEWYASQKNAVHVRAKAYASPRAMLLDLAAVLNVRPHHRTRDLFEAVLAEIMAEQRTMIIDEIDHCARDYRVLETLRDITDTSNTLLIAGGMRGAHAMMKRYPQIIRRIYDVVTFAPYSVSDVQAICDALSDFKIAPDLAAELQRVTGGFADRVMNALAIIDAHGKKARLDKITLADMGDRPLLNNPRAPVRSLSLVKEVAA